MNALVLKEWRAGEKPVDKSGHYVRISGRQAGVIAWVLALLNVDPVTTIRVNTERVEFSQASLSGMASRMIPLEGICSTFYGYHKPWKSSVALFFFLSWLSVALATVLTRSVPGRLLGTLVALAVCGLVAALYYFLSRTLTLGFVELSGVASAIQFKRSVIENVDVDEDQARYICEITQFLIESHRRAPA